MPLGYNVQRKFYIARDHEKEITSFMESRNVSYIKSGTVSICFGADTHVSLL